MIAMLAQQPAPRAAGQAAKQQTRCLHHRKRQLYVSRSSRRAAEELHALVHDIAAGPPPALQTLLQPSITDTVHALASGDGQKASESYSGDAQVRVAVAILPTASAALEATQHARSHMHTHSSSPAATEAFRKYFN